MDLGGVEIIVPLTQRSLSVTIADSRQAVSSRLPSHGAIWKANVRSRR